MHYLKITLSLFVAAVFVLSSTLPSSAIRFFNRDTLQFEDREAGSGSRSYKPIPREIVPYETTYKVGTIIVETAERRLYLVLPDGQALRYGIGVGRDGFTWEGQHKITRMAEWPAWTPPPAMRERVPDLPITMAGGPDNPLGARALYIGSTLYRIHGTSEPWTIGQAVSSGCIRLTNDDIVDLYDRVKVGALVVVHQG